MKNLMKKEEEKNVEVNAKAETRGMKPQRRKASKTWEAAMRLKGSLIVNDPKFLL